MDGQRAKAALYDLLEHGVVYLDSPADCVRVAHVAKANALLPIVSGMCDPARPQGRFYVRILSPLVGRKTIYAFEHRGTLYLAVDPAELRELADELLGGGLGDAVQLEELSTLEVESRRRGLRRVVLIAAGRRN